jgi:hypothetical protein
VWHAWPAAAFDGRPTFVCPFLELLFCPVCFIMRLKATLAFDEGQALTLEAGI